MHTIETARLRIRRLEAADAAFILQLLNEPSWLKHIGDKGVRTLADAEHYIETGPLQMIARFGFGSKLVALKATGEAIGMCGLIKRDTLPDADLGFAFLPEFWGQGYALEAAAATLADGFASFGLTRILAICNQDNHASCRLLEKLGFVFQGLQRLTPDAAELKLFARQF